MEKFDLTTKGGYDKASAFLKGYFEMTPLGMAYKVAKWILDSNTVEKQGKAAEELIKVGKDKGVDEMEIIMDNKKGFHFEAPLEDGVKIDTTAGSDEKLKIRVKYK